MQSLKLKVVIPEDHELVIKLPEEVPAGPAELILRVETPATEEHASNFSVKEASRRFAELAARLAVERPFDELSLEERRERLRQIVGSGRGLFSSPEERARRKQEEIDLEEERLGR